MWIADCVSLDVRACLYNRTFLCKWSSDPCAYVFVLRTVSQLHRNNVIWMHSHARCACPNVCSRLARLLFEKMRWGIDAASGCLAEWERTCTLTLCRRCRQRRQIRSGSAMKIVRLCMSAWSLLLPFACGSVCVQVRLCVCVCAHMRVGKCMHPNWVMV